MFHENLQDNDNNNYDNDGLINKNDSNCIIEDDAEIEYRDSQSNYFNYDDDNGKESKGISGHSQNIFE